MRMIRSLQRDRASGGLLAVLTLLALLLQGGAANAAATRMALAVVDPLQILCLPSGKAAGDHGPGAGCCATLCQSLTTASAASPLPPAHPAPAGQALLIGAGGDAGAPAIVLRAFANRSRAPPLEP